jgi:activator of 2-hydroxyglutaryl-CoA dehydratase
LISTSTILIVWAIKDFAMNEVCAAGTEAFLDEQAYRLGIDIQDFASTQR